MLTPATLLATVLRRAGQELRCARRASDAAIHAFTCTDALVAIHARTQDPIALLCAAVHLSERPCAVEGAPPADGPTDLIARARRASREHAVDPHHFKFAAALAAMSRHASPSERAYLRACAGRAPVFSSSEVWANAETVRLRLRG
jgi:hypothetical protein